MSDESWRNLKEPWERVRWARARKFGTAKDAADALGIKPGTYGGYERPAGSSRSVPLKHQLAAKLGNKFKVDWKWLLTGEGAPFKDKVKDQALERIARAIETGSDEEVEYAAELVERLLGTGTHG